MSQKTQAIETFTAEVLSTIPQPWPEYITLLVFLAIEHQETFLHRYHEFIEERALTEEDPQGRVNTFIGMYVRKLTGRQVVKRGNPSKCKLITCYSRLG